MHPAGSGERGAMGEMMLIHFHQVKSMLLPHGGWPMAAGPASRLGSVEPGDKTGLRLLTTPT